MQLQRRYFLSSGLMNKELERKFGTFLFYMLTAARILYVQRWKDTLISTTEEWKVMELMEMAKWTALIKEKNLSGSWKLLLDLSLKNEKKNQNF